MSESTYDYQNFEEGLDLVNCTNGTMQLNCSGNATKVPDDVNAYVLPWWRQLIWSVLFVSMATVSTCGNLIVIWTVMAQKRMRTVTNIFIVNLSIADTMVSSLNVTFNFVYMLTGHWPFGNVYCKICSFISILSVCGSVFTLIAISVDRYNAIIRPLSPRMSRPTTILIAVTIWIVGMLIALPQLLYFTTQQYEDGRVSCYPDWPDGDTNHSVSEFIYNISFMVVTYFLPMLSMSVTYAKIGAELWGARAIGEATAVQRESINSKRRVVKMMMMVVMVFGVCWLPYQVYFIIGYVYPDIVYSPYIQEIYLSIYWLAMSYSMYNPMIYCFMNQRFRQGFMNVFNFYRRRCCFCFYLGSFGSRNDISWNSPAARHDLVSTADFSTAGPCSRRPGSSRKMPQGDGMNLKDLNNTLSIPPPYKPHATRSNDKNSSSRRSSTCSMSITITVSGNGNGGGGIGRQAIPELKTSTKKDKIQESGSVGGGPQCREMGVKLQQNGFKSSASPREREATKRGSGLHDVSGGSGGHVSPPPPPPPPRSQSQNLGRDDADAAADGDDEGEKKFMCRRRGPDGTFL